MDLHLRLEKNSIPVTECGCHLWTGYVNRQGYGSLSVHSRPTMAHRVAWELAHGKIPDGMFVLHHCDVPACINVDHLFLGTQADNMADKIRKGRGADLRGEGNTQAILTEDAVRHIRVSKERLRILAARYNVSLQTIKSVRGSHRWRHVNAS